MKSRKDGRLRVSVGRPVKFPSGGRFRPGRGPARSRGCSLQCPFKTNFILPLHAADGKRDTYAKQEENKHKHPFKQSIQLAVMGNVGETMQKSLIAPAADFAKNPLAGLGVGGKKEAFVAKVGEPLTFVELWVRQWVDVFDKKHGTWCVFVVVGKSRRLASRRRVTRFSILKSTRLSSPHSRLRTYDHHRNFPFPRASN